MIKEDVMYTQETLSELKSKELQTLAKEYKVKNWWKMKKADLAKQVWEVLPVKLKPNLNSTSSDIEKETEEFESNGGQVEECKPQKNPKRVPPTMSSAEKNPRGKKPKKVKGDSTVKKSRVKRIREDDNIVTLQSIINELNLAGQLARKALRASGIEKPGKQWCWEKGSKELKKVQELMELTAGISSEIKKSKKS